MNPEAVLTEDQKKVRFRNVMRKKACKRSVQFISREIIEDDSSDSVSGASDSNINETIQEPESPEAIASKKIKFGEVNEVIFDPDPDPCPIGRRRILKLMEIFYLTCKQAS